MNDTVRTLLEHRTVRSFTGEPVSEDVMQTLFEVARRTATAAFYQGFHIIRVKDPKIREVLHEASTQPYVGGSKGELLVFVADVYRNAKIREEAGLEPGPEEWATLYNLAQLDAALAAQSVVVAAESLGLGTVYLGSINRQRPQVAEALGLPERTAVVFGLLIGHPEKVPAEQKPRIPLELLVSVDTYRPAQDYHARLAAYDREVQAYYGTREENSREDTFTNHIEANFGAGGAEQAPMLEFLHGAKLALRDRP